MKDYIQRLIKACHPVYFIVWWLFRLPVIYALISCASELSANIDAFIQYALTLAVMFAWEFCMAMPKKSFMRLMPASLQLFSSALLFAAAFLGEYLNLYHTVPWLDEVLQFIFGGFSVFVGYEIACALTIRDKYSCTKAMHFWVAFGIGFISMNCLELFEFFLDQINGIVTGMPGNAQYWYSEIESAGVEKTLIDYIDPYRWPLMDTMIDIILNTLSAFLALLIINLFPYRLRGKYRYDMEFDRKDAVRVK